MRFDIPGFRKIELEYLVMDYNGTLAVDGQLIDGVRERLNRIAADLELYVITADTFGRAAAGLEGISCSLSILPAENQTAAKRDFVNQLGSDCTAAIGNGRNDRLMLEAAGLGIAVILLEGAAVQTLMAADVVCPSILAALDLFTNPLRLTATLRG